MSQLTQGAQDLRAAEERLKTGNFLTDFVIDRVRESVQPDGKGGTKTTGGWGFIGDRLGLDSTEIRERKGAFDTRVQTDTAIDNSGATREELEEARGGRPITRAADVPSALRALQKLEAQELVDSDRSHQATVRNEGYQQAAQTLAAQQQHSTATLAAQLASADKKFLLQMADSADQRAADTRLQMAQFQMQMDREDRRERRADKKDRQAALMQLMQGLAQMGASIAI